MKYFYNGILNNNPPFDKEDFGFFETMRVFKGNPVFMDDHIQRCNIALKYFGIENKEINFEKIILEHINVFYNLLKSDYIRFRIQFNFDRIDSSIFIWSQGEPFNKNICLNNKLYINCNYYYKRGDEINEYRDFKNKSRGIYSSVKKHAEMEGRFDSILVDSEKNISDTSICNVFAIKGDVIYTPNLHLGGLKGILRKNLLLFLRKSNLNVVETNISDNDLLMADEVFLTNVIRGILPVNQIEERKFEIHNWTYKIQHLFRKYQDSF